MIDKYICNNNQGEKEAINIYNNLFRNSESFNRRIHNIVFSINFQLIISDDINLIKKTGSKLTYLETRIMTYIRNKNTSLDGLRLFIMYILDEKEVSINSYRVDYKLFEVLHIFMYHIRDYKLIDNLIITHHIVYSLWSSGSILFKYYTHHNEIHSIEIINIINQLIIQIDSQKLNKYEKYLLYTSAYLHDISMAIMPKKNSYDSKEVSINESNSIKSKSLVNDFREIEQRFRNIEKLSLEYLDKLSEFIRKTHAKRSASEINTMKELNFLENAVRVLVSEISKAHTMTKNELISKNYEANEIMDIFKMIKLLRIADVLDIKKDRTSEVLLNNNMDFMSEYSMFQWAGHLIVDNFKIKSDYKKVDNYIEETIVLQIKLNYGNKEMVINDLDFDIKYESLDYDQTRYKINYSDKKTKSKEIPYVLKFLMKKNEHLFKEIEWFFSTINASNSIYKTSVVYEVFITPKTRLNNEVDDIVRKNIIPSPISDGK